MTRVMAAALVVVLSGCGGGDDGAGRETQLGGIYSLTGWTRNDAGCGAGGASVLATQAETMLLVRGNALFGTYSVEVVPCLDAAECRAEANDSTLHISQFGMLEDGSDAAGWTGSFLAAGFSGDTCDGRLTETVLTSTGAATIRLTAKRTPTGPFPRGADGFCSVQAARAAISASQRACAELEVVSAARVERL